MDRNVNYSPEENPEKWQKFVDFTHNQIMELMTKHNVNKAFSSIFFMIKQGKFDKTIEQYFQNYQNKKLYQLLK